MEALSEAQVAAVSGHLAAVLGQDNQLRKQHEVELNNLREQFPNELVLCLLKNLAENPDASIRMLSAVLLRNMLSALGHLKIWKNLTEQVQNLSKQVLLQVVTTEQQRSVRTKICDAIGELGSNVLSSETGEWPELSQFLFQSAQGQELVLKASSLHILAGLFTFLYKKLQENSQLLLNIFQDALSSQDLYVRIAGLEAACSFLSVIDSKDTQPFVILLPSLLQSVYFVASQSEVDGKDVFDYITELIEAEPKFFNGYVAQCAELVNTIFAIQTDDLGLKNVALEFMIALFERQPNYFKQNPEIGQQIINKSFEMMVTVQYEVDDSWAKPQEGFQEQDNDEDVEIDYVKVGRKLVGRLVISVGDTHLLPIVMPIVQQAISNEQDWRYKYTGLMVICEIVNQITEPEKIAELVPILIQHTNSNFHPKIRYAAFNCIGQISEDFEFEFQQAHHQEIVPVLLAGVDDPIPRVKAHCCGAITNFFEGAGDTIASSYANDFIAKLVPLISNNNISLVIEHALTALAGIAHGCKTQFSQFYNQLMPFLFNIIDQYQQKEYKKLRGRAIECLTLMCNAVGMDIFAQHAEKVIELLIRIQTAELSPDDPQKSYILSGWQRIAAVMKEHLAPYLGNILPGLLNMASATAQVSMSTNPDSELDVQALLQDEKKKISLMTSSIEDKEVGLQTLITISEILGELYAPYVEQTLTVAYPLISYSINENIRSSAASLLAVLVGIMGSSQDRVQQTINSCQLFLPKLWEVAEKEYDNETLVVQLDAIKKLIQAPNVPFLTQEDVNQTGERAIKMLDESLKKRDRNKVLDQLDSDGEDDEELKKINVREEDWLHTAISEVLGSLFKTHTEHSLNIVNFMYTNVLSKFLTEQSSKEDIKFAIFVIDDIIEFIGQDLAADKWVSLAEVLVKYAADQEDPIRQAACYGLGILAKKSNNEIFSSWTTQILQVLEAAIVVPVKDNQRTHGHARDNAIAAIGRMIRYQHANLDLNTVVYAWVKLLPLRFDKPEAKEAHDMLADMCMSNPEIVYGSDLSNLKHVVWLFADILEGKTVEEKTLPKIRTIIQGLQSQNVPQLTEIWAELTDVQRSKVSKLLG